MADKCFLCSRPMKSSRYVVDTGEDQAVVVGSDCFKKINDAGKAGLKVPDSGVRLYPMTAKRKAYFESRKMLDSVQPVPVDDVEITYHMAKKPAKPAPIMNVANKEDREKMKTGVQPFGTKGKTPGATDDSTVSPGVFLHADDVQPVPVGDFHDLNPPVNPPPKVVPISAKGATAKEIEWKRREAVQKEINKDKRIGGKEASTIHRLLKGRTGDAKRPPSPEDILKMSSTGKSYSSTTRNRIIRSLAEEAFFYWEREAEASKELGRKDEEVEARKIGAAYKSLMLKAKLGDVQPVPVKDAQDTQSIWKQKVKAKHPKVTFEMLQAAGEIIAWENGKQVAWYNLDEDPSIKPLTRAKDASPFERDTDKGAEAIVQRERNNGLTAKQIAAKYGFSISFVLEVGNKQTGKDSVQPVANAGSKTCKHTWQEVDAEPPYDVCNSCGAVRY